MNLPGRERKCIFPLHTVRRSVQGAEKSLITVGELQKLVTSWGHKVSKITIRCHLHASKLFGWVARKTLLSPNHKCKCLEFAKGHWNLNWNKVLLSDETEIELFGNKHLRWDWRKKSHSHAENDLIPTELWWWICDVVGLFGFYWSWGPCNRKVAGSNPQADKVKKCCSAPEQDS